MKTRLPPEIVKEIVARVLAGFSVAEVARDLRLDQHVVGKVVMSLPVPGRDDK